MKPKTKALVLTSFGGCLEFYDFIIFALFGVYFSQTIFPSGDNPIIALIQTYAVFAAGYIARPFGGVLLGHIGDTLGRKKAMKLSIAIMLASTLAMAMMPGYQSIGLWAPVLFSLCRIIQGIALGGELPGCIAYISEAMPEQKGFACGVVFCAVLHGISLGALVEWLLTLSFSQQDLYAYAWRIPFFIGALLGFITYLLRRTATETIQLHSTSLSSASPFKKLIKYYPKQVFAGAMVTGLIASIVSLVFLVMNQFLISLSYGYTEASSAELINIVVSASMIMVWGYLSDRFNPINLLLIAAGFFAVVAWGAYYSIIHHQVNLLMMLLLLGVFFSICWGTIPPILAGLYPSSVRFSGVALSYNLGFAIFGGLAPVSVTYFNALWDTYYMGLFYLWFAATLCCCGLWMIRQLQAKVAVPQSVA